MGNHWDLIVDLHPRDAWISTCASRFQRPASPRRCEKKNRCCGDGGALLESTIECGWFGQRWPKIMGTPFLTMASVKFIYKPGEQLNMCHSIYIYIYHYYVSISCTSRYGMSHPWKDQFLGICQKSLVACCGLRQYMGVSNALCRLDPHLVQWRVSEYWRRGRCQQRLSNT